LKVLFSFTVNDAGTSSPSARRLFADPPKEFPVHNENNSLVPAARRFVHAAQAATNQEQPCVRPRTRSKISLINSLMQGIRA